MLNGNFKIQKKLSSGLVISHDGENILVRTRMSLAEGDYISILGKINKPSTKMQNYLYTQKIVNVIYYSRIKILATNSDFRNLFSSYLNTGSKMYSNYINLVLLGVKTRSNYDVYKLAIKLNVVHLFVISGFHITLLFTICKKLLSWCQIPMNLSSLIALILTFLYLYLLRFPLSASRAFCLTLLGQINLLFFKKKFSNLLLLSIVMLAFVIVDPYKISSLSFTLTFTATFSIFLFNEISFKTK